MGSSTSSDVVKFAVRHVAEGDICHFQDPKILMMCGQDREEIIDEGGDLTEFDSKGWQRDIELNAGQPQFTKLGKRGNLYADATFTKGDKYLVCTINESCYAAGGGLELALVAGDVKSLGVFMTDFGIVGEIQVDVSIHQTS
jgi:hypothetical protein